MTDLTPRVEEPEHPIVELRNVFKSFQHLSILRGVNLQIFEREFFSIIGPSGCGKTTLMKIVAGLLLPDEGTVLIDGRDQTKDPPYLRDVNLVFQNYALFPHLSVFDNIAFGLTMKGMPKKEIKERVQELLQAVHLTAKIRNFPDELSGGEKQRVALARAMVNRPKVLLLDEPLAHLDLKMRLTMREELARLQKEMRITFLMVTHDQEEALALSDRIAVMREGYVLQTGQPQTVYESPKNSFVANFVGTSNILHGTVVGIEAGNWISERLRISLGNGSDELVVVNHNPNMLLGGRPVAISIRPERLHITSTPADAFVNKIIGKVEEVSFLGFEIFYKVRINHGTDQIMMVRTLYSPIKKIREKGERVILQWRCEDAKLLEC